jgi:hypothetical protein
MTILNISIIKRLIGLIPCSIPHTKAFNIQATLDMVYILFIFREITLPECP